MFGKRDVYTFKDDKPPKKKRDKKTATGEKPVAVKHHAETTFEECLYPIEEKTVPQKQSTVEENYSNPKKDLKSFFFKGEDIYPYEDEQNDIYDDETYEDEKKEKAKKPKRKKFSNPQKERVSFLRDKKKIGLTLIAISLIVILVVSPTINMMTATEMTTAVVALQDIKKGTKIESKMFYIAQVARSSLLPIHISDKSLAIDKYAKTDIAKDEMLSTPKLAHTLPFDNSYLYTLTADKKALSVAIPSLSSGLSSKLQSGDIISVYANLSGDKADDEYIATLPPELTYVKVLAVTNNEGFDLSSTPEKSELDNPIADTLILEVNDLQAMLLVGLQANAQIHIALVCRGDEEKAITFLKIQDEYFLKNAVAKKETEENNE